MSQKMKEGFYIRLSVATN